MPGKDVAREWADAFVAAGHVPAPKTTSCEKCGTTLFDFIKKGRLPCLMTDS